MDKCDFVWDHFKFNAEQRLRGFNFFVLLSIFSDGGVITAMEKEVDSKLLFLLGLFVALLAIVFWLVDRRSRQLLDLTIPALKDMESKFDDKYRLFTEDANTNCRVVRFIFSYTFAIRVLLLAQFAFGISVAWYNACWL